MCEPISMAAMMAEAAAAAEVAAAAAAAAEGATAVAATAETAMTAAEVAAAAEAAAAAQPAMQAGLLNAAPGVLQPGMQAAGTLDSLLINNGMGQQAGGLLTKGVGSLMGDMAGGGGPGSKMMMANMGMQMMNPQQQPQQRAPAMPMGGGQQGPLPLPYGTPAGNSLGIGMPGSEEEMKRKLRMMGYQV